jgi:cystathionine beta-lyase
LEALTHVRRWCRWRAGQGRPNRNTITEPKGGNNPGMDFNRITLAELRERQSAKWRTYGPDVLPAWIAETDVELAPPIQAALQEAIARGDTGYSHLPFLEGAVAGWLEATYGKPVEPADVIGVPDVMVGIAETMRLVSEPGSGVVINPPVYPPFFHVIPTVGRTVVEVPLQDGELDLVGLRGAFAAGARTYLLCNPHNPTGAVWPAQTLAGLPGWPTSSTSPCSPTRYTAR